ncbi:MAG TPA: hypothetical protein VFE47_00550 [Tepidisphaeraceae bacterium]|nr:hypothetical protein [Tepidisphaeraceae bacterium]
MIRRQPPHPVHVPGSNKGEELVMHHGREAGRETKGKKGYRSARDSTSVNPENQGPIDPRMPEMPPA